MGLDINGALINSSNNAISITTNSNVGLDFSSGDIPIFAYRPAFMVERTDNQVLLTGGAYNKISFTNAVYDDGSNFNTSTARFTAPVTGTYILEFHIYGDKANSTANTAYTHPLFYVNGSQISRQASNNVPLRLRTRTSLNAGYAYDTQINDVFYLTAGDYVEPYVYASSALRYFGYHSSFSGAFVG